MSRFITSLFLFLFTFEQLAFGGSPFIWGDDSRAQNLQSSGILFSNKQTIDADGLRNYIKNQNGITTLGWTDVGTGTTVSTDTTTANIPLYPYVDRALKIANDGSSTGYTYYQAQLAPNDTNRLLGLCWEQKPGAGYTSSDYSLYVYSDDNSGFASPTQVALSTDSGGLTAIPASSGQFCTTFSVASAEIYVQVRIQRAAGSSGATIFMDFNNINLGPGQVIQGAITTDWAAYTPTLSSSGGGVSKATSNTEVANWRRVGSSMEIYYSYRQTSSSGAGSGSGDYYWSIPSGYTIDTSKLNVVTSDPKFAQASVGDAGAYSANASLEGAIGFAFVYNSTGIAIHVAHGTAGNQTVGSGWYGAGSDNNIQYTFHAFVPISQWAGSGVVNLAQNSIEFASVGGTWDAASTTTVYGPSGSAMGGALTAARDKTITWQTPILPTQRVQIWASKDQVSWFPINGAQLGSGNDAVIPGTLADGSVAAGVSVRPGATAYETIVTFARYLKVANDDAPTTDWPSSAAYWVATKSIGALPLGFNVVSQFSSGLMPASLANLDDSAATRMGMKSYYSGTNYKSSISPTLSGTNVTTVRGVLIPYQMQDLSWHCRGNLNVTVTGAPSSLALSINGLTSKTGPIQAVTARTDSGSADFARIPSGSSTITITGGGTFANVAVSFDIELDSQPTWAY
jgi:hypothetical protein